MGWLWTTSKEVVDGHGIVRWWRRARFLLEAGRYAPAIKPFINADPRSAFGRYIRERPETVGAVLWPYQCVAWGPSARLARIRDHYQIVESHAPYLDFAIEQQLLLADLHEVKSGLRVFVDQPVWFVREGQLAINLVVGKERVYTLAFSFFREGSQIGAFVGAIQGRDIEGIMDCYRELTKAANGLRPRDLLMEMFRFFCAEVGVVRILAVTDQSRHHRDTRYFGAQAAEKHFSSNYDRIWEERGGMRVNAMWYDIPMTLSQREPADIPAKKRGMYRRRMQMLENIHAQIREGLSRCLLMRDQID